MKELCCAKLQSYTGGEDVNHKNGDWSAWMRKRRHAEKKKWKEAVEKKEENRDVCLKIVNF